MWAQKSENWKEKENITFESHVNWKMTGAFKLHVYKDYQKACIKVENSWFHYIPGCQYHESREQNPGICIFIVQFPIQAGKASYFWTTLEK